MKDLTVLAIPLYLGGMGWEYLALKEREEALSEQREVVGATAGAPYVSGALYQRDDTLASLSMGVASLVVPYGAVKLLRPLVPGRGRYGTALLGLAATAAVLTTAADWAARAARRRGDRAREELAGAAARVGGPIAVVAGGIAVTTTWADRTSMRRLWNRRLLPDLGSGPCAAVAAVVGWDFVYYWNHRLMHGCRALWAVHVVHHSSQHYNLSTALRQPVAEFAGAYVPYGLLCLLGIRPELVSTARGVNLLYQFWIHTEAVESLGKAEATLNSPSHHRVHHGSNGRYLDRNHGSILIVWDRLFGTFEGEDEPPRYGLTKNIGTDNPLRIATHEHIEMLRDVARSTSWRDRLGFVLRGPRWAGVRRSELEAEPIRKNP